MEAREAQLKREQRRYEGQREARRHTVANLAVEWDKPDFTIEQKQAAIAESLTAVIILPAGRGKSFHPDQIRPFSKSSDQRRARKPVWLPADVPLGATLSTAAAIEAVTSGLPT